MIFTLKCQTQRMPFTCDWTSPKRMYLYFTLTVSTQSERDQNEERGGPAAEPHQILPRTVQVRRAHTHTHVYLLYIFSLFCLLPVHTHKHTHSWWVTCCVWESYWCSSLFSFFQDGLKAVDNLKPSIEKLATDLHTVRAPAPFSLFFSPPPFFVCPDVHGVRFFLLDR